MNVANFTQDCIIWKVVLLAILGMHLMSGLIFLGIIAAGASIAWIADELEDEDTNSSDEPDASAPEEEGQNLVFNGDADLVGTEGNDTLSAGQDEDLAPEQISLLGGDDTATLDVHIGVEVSGGEGNDVLTSTAVGNVLDGGEGNDTLRGIDANNMLGGAGDDEITFDSDVEPNSSTARIAGGEGNDTIAVFANVGVDAPDRGGAVITGGEGSDSFEVTLHLENSTVDLDGSGGPLETGIARIDDFDPDEDSLLIQLEADEDARGRVFQTNLDQVEEDGRYVSTFTFTFPESQNIADAAEAQAILTVVSNAPFDLEDVTLMRV